MFFTFLTEYCRSVNWHYDSQIDGTLIIEKEELSLNDQPTPHDLIYNAISVGLSTLRPNRSLSELTDVKTKVFWIFFNLRNYQEHWRIGIFFLVVGKSNGQEIHVSSDSYRINPKTIEEALATFSPVWEKNLPFFICHW